jgi:hypothetical protein
MLQPALPPHCHEWFEKILTSLLFAGRFHSARRIFCILIYGGSMRFKSVLILLFIYCMVFADTTEFRVVIVRNDATVGGELHGTIQARIAGGSSPRTANSMTIDIYYGSQYAPWTTDPAINWAFSAANGYAANISKLTGYYRLLVTGNDVNSSGSGTPAGWDVTAQWQSIVTLRWRIQQVVNPVNLSIRNETGASAFFSNLHDNPHGQATNWVFTNGGVVSAQPEMRIVQEGTEIPSATGSCDFGAGNDVGFTTAKTFSIENIGPGPLTLTGAPLVQISGTNAAEFFVTQQPVTPVIPNGSTQFIIQFTAAGTGVRTATVTIANNDADENPYHFDIRCTIIDQEFTTGSLTGYKKYIPLSGPTIKVTSGYLRMALPSSAIFNHTASIDRAPQLRRTLNMTDWSAETRAKIISASSSKYQSGLIVYFSRYDLFYWGFYGTKSTLKVVRGGSTLFSTSYSGGTAVELRVRKNGSIYFFEYRTPGAAVWTLAGTQTVATVPVDVGLISKTWVAQTLTVDFDYLRLSVDELKVLTESLSTGAVGAVYNAQLEASGGTPPYTWDLASGILPAGLTLNASGQITGTPTAASTTNFSARVSDNASPSVQVVKNLTLTVIIPPPIDEEFATGTLNNYIQYVPVAGPVISATAIPGYLRISTPSTASYDHWVTTDRAPQLRRTLTAANWEVSTKVKLVVFAGRYFFTGLIVYFSKNDVYYWGFNDSNKTLRLSRTGQSGLINVAYSSGVEVELRIRKIGSDYHFEYRSPGATAWIDAGTQTTPTVPVSIGLILKTTNSVNIVADFDYLRLQDSTGATDAAYSTSEMIALDGLPKNFSLSNGFPNPFNPETHFSLSLVKTDHVSAVVYNMLGQRIRSLQEGVLEAGEHQIVWDGRDDSGLTANSGIYMVVFQVGDESYHRKVMMVK